MGFDTTRTQQGKHKAEMCSSPSGTFDGYERVRSMSFYFFAGFFFTTLLSYTAGRNDGDNGSDAGLVILTIVNVIVLVWIIATWWATR